MRVAACLVLMSAIAIEGNPKCWTEMHAAAEVGDADQLGELLARDRFAADAEDLCESGIRPLLLATNSGSEAAVRALVEAGASVDVAHSGNGVTPLIAAAATGNVEMVRLLVEARAKVNRAEDRNWTALFFAVQAGQEAVMELLVSRGADVNWLSAGGITPWMIAKEMNHAAALAQLEAAGANQDDEGTLWLVGQLPLEELGKLGVSDAGSFERLFGSFAFRKLTTGVDPKQLAVHTTIQMSKSGKMPAEGDSIAVSPSAVGSGPMAMYQGADFGADKLVLSFDSQPGAMMWQVLAVTSEGKASAYLRSELPDESVANRWDPVHTTGWEIPISMAPPQSGMKWIRAEHVRFVRGSEGERLWRAQQEGRDADKEEL